MLAAALVEEVDRLLTEGRLSQREIAMRLSVSRGSVSAIATGRRGLAGKEPAEEVHSVARGSVPIRCPRCGYCIYAPCLICRTRAHRARQRRRRIEPFRAPLRSDRRSDRPSGAN
jgi:transcriptional regulator with XRE-family HTH domain